MIMGLRLGNLGGFSGGGFFGGRGRVKSPFRRKVLWESAQ